MITNSRKMPAKFTISLIAVFTFLLVSCKSGDGPVRARGPIVEKTFEFGKDFDRIEIRNGWNVRLIHSPRLRAVSRTQKNIVDYVYPRVINGRLIIDFSQGASIVNITTQAIDVYYKNLNEINVTTNSTLVSDIHLEQAKLDLIASKGGTIALSNLKVGALRVNASEEATLKLTGTGVNFTGDLSKKAELNGEDLKVIKANIKAASGAKVFIDVIEELKADSQSGALIQYTGEPVFINKSKD